MEDTYASRAHYDSHSIRTPTYAGDDELPPVLHTSEDKALEPYELPPRLHTSDDEALERYLLDYERCKYEVTQNYYNTFLEESP